MGKKEQRAKGGETTALGKLKERGRRERGRKGPGDSKGGDMRGGEG